MGKSKWMLTLIVGIFFLLATSACGGGAEGASNSSIVTPIQRIKNLELNILGVQSDIDQGLIDYSLSQSRIDQIREDLDALAAQLSGVTDGPITLEMYDEMTANISIIQRVLTAFDDRLDILEESYNGS